MGIYERSNSQFLCRKSILEHKISRDPNQPRDFLDVYLAEIEKKENPNFDQESLELTCLDLFKVFYYFFLLHHFNFSFVGRGGDNINNLALVSFLS